MDGSFSKKMYAIGIDLGTTNSCAAIYRNQKIEIIESEEGHRTTRSFVFYSDNVVVGEEAIKQAIYIPENGVFDSKRLIGRKYYDVIKDMSRSQYPFHIIKAHQDEPLIDIPSYNLQLRPEEVSAEILRKLKEDACKFTGETIRNVVITVPAYFTNPQRQATEDAAKIAGLHVLKLLNEPTAAALAFAEDRHTFEGRTVLVYDLGGGTFDVSIIVFKRGEGNVVAVGGDKRLGGRDFDDNLLNYCIGEIKERYKYAIAEQKKTNQRRAIRRLRSECEIAKKKLSQMEVVYVDMEEFYGNDVTLEITREFFEEMNAEAFRKTIEILDDTLKRAKIDKDEIDDVVLVGGSTRILKIRQLVQEYFPGKQLNKSVHPEEGVAIGAALQAAILSHHPMQHFELCQINDVTPLSLGIETDLDQNRTMSVIIPRNSAVPADGTKTYRTIADKQTAIEIRIFEGEDAFVTNNIFLGEITIEGITPKKKGKVTVDVIFRVDYNGMLKVMAQETSKKITKALNIVLNNGRLTEEQIQQIRSNLKTI